MSTESHLPAAGKPDGQSSKTALATRGGNAPLTVNKSLDQMAAKIAGYPEPVHSEALWLQGFMFNRCQNSPRALHAMMERAVPGFARSVEWVYNVISGQQYTCEANKWKTGGLAETDFLTAVAALRRHEKQLSAQGSFPFIVTPTYRALEAFITAHRAVNAVSKFGGIIGHTGRQKTRGTEYYCEQNNHQTCTSVQAPRSGKLSTLQRRIARKYSRAACRITFASSREEVIYDNLNESRTLIIDNAQRLYVARKGTEQDCFDWLLEVQDETKCTVILIFVADFRKTLFAAEARGYFEQFIGRFGGESNLLVIPEYAPDSDLRAIATAFGLKAGPGAMEYLRRWSRQLGRDRIVFDRLQRAQSFCRLDERTRITLEDLEEADKYSPPQTLALEEEEQDEEDEA